MELESVAKGNLRIDVNVGARERAERQLIEILCLAYSGEKAAAFAYRGHWKAVADREQRERIREIENEEWHHRDLVGEMLRTLNSSAPRVGEIRAAMIGRVLAFLCHLIGWLPPMYAAGRLESGNIREYETAARYARDSGHTQFVDCLLNMAEVEWEHEAYFRGLVQQHWLGRLLPMWRQPPPRESIRSAFVSNL